MQQGSEKGRRSLRYDKMVENALRGVVREALARGAPAACPVAHHFYITSGPSIPGWSSPQLSGNIPEEMTIVLQHQFWGLEVEEDAFSVTLAFQSRMERLTIPFAAITAFADPSVKFGLQFQAPAAGRRRDRRKPSPFRRDRRAALQAARRQIGASSKKKPNGQAPRSSPSTGSANASAALDAGRETAILRLDTIAEPAMSDFTYHELFPLGADATPYRKLTGDFVGTGDFKACRSSRSSPRR